MAKKGNDERTIEVKGLEPEQKRFFECTDTIHSFIGGYGSGKTYVFLRKALKCLIEQVGAEGKSNGWIIYPTYRLAEELFVEPFLDILDTVGIRYNYHQAKYILRTQYGDIRIFQLERPHRIIGSNLTWIGFDEFDVASWKNCDIAFRKSLGRMRGSETPQMFFVSTPEGNHYLYKIFVKDNPSGTRKMFNARTSDNPHLPDGYVEMLEENYDSRTLQAYRDGKFVNMTSGQVYMMFSRDRNVREMKWSDRLPVCVLCDFNRGDKPMSWSIAQEQGDVLYVRAALSKKQTDTFDMIHYLDSELRNLNGGELPHSVDLYGDYSGNRNTSNSKITDWEIIESHLREKKVRVVNYSRPCRSVINGVASLNNRLEKKKVVIHPEAIDMIEDLELTVWDKSGQKEDQGDDNRSHMSSGLRYYMDIRHPLEKRIQRF